MNLDYLRRFGVNRNLFASPNEKHRLPPCHLWPRGTPVRLTGILRFHVFRRLRRRCPEVGFWDSKPVIGNNAEDSIRLRRS